MKRNDELAALFAAWREDIDSEPFHLVFVPKPRDGVQRSTEIGCSATWPTVHGRDVP